MTASATNSELGNVNVLVMAPFLGTDLSFVSDVDTRIRVLDGNAAYLAEVQAQGLPTLSGALAQGALPSLEERDALLAKADVLLISHPVLRHVASRAPRLRWVHHTQAGVSNLWESDLWDSEVMLTSSRGFVAATSIAQYVIAGVLFFARGLYDASLDKRTGHVDRSHYQTHHLQGATIGIVGLGGIGREVARFARGFSMRVVATRASIQSPQRDADGADLVLPADRLEEVAAQSDFLAICAQLTQETKGLVNRRVFACMKPSAILINVSRGELVDEDALIEALESGRIRGAVLDVYRGELEGKPPRTELMEFPQVLLTSHISGGGADRETATRDLFRQNLRKFLDAESLVNVVDRSRGY